MKKEALQRATHTQQATEKDVGTNRVEDEVFDFKRQAENILNITPCVSLQNLKPVRKGGLGVQQVVKVRGTSQKLLVHDLWEVNIQDRKSVV